mmetsp:Transcript_80782/g.195947  ORF Transcript_80782/g.195947 Transcript_80782/m.195947 type:complete len:245 (-) Transcript_80782:230-964(-)
MPPSASARRQCCAWWRVRRSTGTTARQPPSVSGRRRNGWSATASQSPCARWTAPRWPACVQPRAVPRWALAPRTRWPSCVPACAPAPSPTYWHRAAGGWTDRPRRWRGAARQPLSNWTQATWPTSCSADLAPPRECSTPRRRPSASPATRTCRQGRGVGGQSTSRSSRPRKHARGSSPSRCATSPMPMGARASARAALAATPPARRPWLAMARTSRATCACTRRCEASSSMGTRCSTSAPTRRI